MVISRPAPAHWSRAFILVIPAIYLAALVIFADRIGPSDYDQFLVFHELQYWNATLFGPAKQWSPVMCSGLSLAGEPQVPFASLTMLLGYVLGPLKGIVAGVIAYLAVGWAGAYLYSGLWMQEREQRSLAASLFIGNGFFICRLAHGHLDFMPFLALPLALWIIHRTSDRMASEPFAQSALAILILGSVFAVGIDGSPVTLIHWVFWIGLYSAVLSFVRRSVLPAAVFVAACALASVLDAGYLWPMLNAQADFPRRTADTFTGPWSLPWFMLIPMRGKVLPANGTGIELSVFIGPVLFYLIWRYRHVLRSQLPREIKLPLLIVSLASIWLGMGSLRLAHIPVWLSPFDWLRPLPGFRSMNVTGRFWGFLALPLSLLAAAALWRFIHTELATRRRALLLASALLIQIVFQSESALSTWWPSRVYAPASVNGVFNGTPQQIAAVRLADGQHTATQQGAVISPTTAVVDCYDLDDFTRAAVNTGTNLIKDISTGAALSRPNTPLAAGFITWNRIRIQDAQTTTPVAGDAHADRVLHIVLNQAFHTQWSSPDCELTRGERGNLVANCPAQRLFGRSVDLVFSDPVSDLGVRMSLRSGTVVAVAIMLLGLMSLMPKRREVTAPSAVRE